MATFLEFQIKGGGCAIIDTTNICGAMNSSRDAFCPGTADSPTLVILRSGESLNVVGDSAGHVIARIVRVRQILRNLPGADVHVDWITPLGGDVDDADEQPAG